MEITETVDSINKQLTEIFGIDTISTRPIWRIVYSEDQFEHRFGEYEDRSPQGLYLRTVRESRYVPKYRPWIDHKYILERLVAVPEINQNELLGLKTSYEPIWVFQDKYENALPPKFEACQLIINTIYAAQYGTGNLKKFIDPNNLEESSKRVDKIVEELFGEQSSLQGTTVTGESVAYTGPIKES